MWARAIIRFIALTLQREHRCGTTQQAALCILLLLLLMAGSTWARTIIRFIVLMLQREHRCGTTQQVAYVDSSPAVADGRVYVGSDDGRVYCLDASTGAQVWNYTTGGGWILLLQLLVVGSMWARMMAGFTVLTLQPEHRCGTTQQVTVWFLLPLLLAAGSTWAQTITGFMP